MQRPGLAYPTPGELDQIVACPTEATERFEPFGNGAAMEFFARFVDHFFGLLCPGTGQQLSDSLVFLVRFQVHRDSKPLKDMEQIGRHGFAVDQVSIGYSIKGKTIFSDINKLLSVILVPAIKIRSGSMKYNQIGLDSFERVV